MYYSPLRYPGGKNKLAPFIAQVCLDNKINEHYVEPYSGGASVALFLLFGGFVSKVTINDKDRSIYAFWYSVLNHSKKLCQMIEDADLSIGEWKKQKEIQLKKQKADLLELGFSTFYLNRTNRSGIINAGVIGGLRQDGNYKMDCRFNKKDLIARIKKIASRKKDIKLYKKDALKLIDKIQNDSEGANIIFYFDPPYYDKANTLYMNHYQEKDHIMVSEKIKSIQNFHWIISYDNVPTINKLYSGHMKKEFSFKHMIVNKRMGNEVLYISPTLKVTNINNLNPLNFKPVYENDSIQIVYKKITDG